MVVCVNHAHSAYLWFCFFFVGECGLHKIAHLEYFWAYCSSLSITHFWGDARYKQNWPFSSRIGYENMKCFTFLIVWYSHFLFFCMNEFFFLSFRNYDRCLLEFRGVQKTRKKRNNLNIFGRIPNNFLAHFREKRRCEFLYACRRVSFKVAFRRCEKRFGIHKITFTSCIFEYTSRCVQVWNYQIGVSLHHFLEIFHSGKK